VKVADDGFLIGEGKVKEMVFTIHDFAFIRKRFSAGRMTCYSLDAVTSKDGHRCDLCTWNHTCNKVVRLMILISQPSPLPAILDVNEHSLDQIGAILETIEPNSLHTTPVCATLNRNSGRLSIAFELKQ
jgi:hypothetical protein